jgi:flagellar protein FlaG
MEVIKMSIEPIGTVMGLQAQSYSPAPKPVTPSEKMPEAADMNPAKASLEDIAVVDSANSKNGADDSESKNEENQQATKEQMKKAVEKINGAQMENSEAVFGFHEETNRVTIKIVDKKTKEVIKELPPEKTLDMIAKVWELAGLFVNEQR